jgi:serine protease Do/serine protease DegQ
LNGSIADWQEHEECGSGCVSRDPNRDWKNDEFRASHTELSDRKMKIFIPMLTLLLGCFVGAAPADKPRFKTGEASNAFPLDTQALDRTNSARVVSYADVVDRVRPAVVSIFPTKILKKGESTDDDLMRRFFGGGREKPDGDAEGDDNKEQVGAGSGVIISADGYIFTNNHVVAAGADKVADELMVELADRRRYVATLVGRDPKTDIAVLKIDAKKLPYLAMANSEQVKVGDIVFAAGNPFMVGLTVTMGMVSATKRSNLDVLRQGGYESFIQTDAPINPGNSGGALVDSDGRLIGINTAIIGPGGSVGIGFAVPTDLARKVLFQFLETGELKRGFAGVAVDDVTGDDQERLKLPAINGVLVKQAREGLPAAVAGLKEDDVITNVGDWPVATKGDFRTGVAYSIPGSTVPFAVIRGGKAMVVNVVIGSQDDPAAQGQKSEVSELLPGVKAKGIEPADRAQWRLTDAIKGLLVVEVETGSDVAGKLKAGMVILEINNTAVDSATSAEKALKKGINKLKVQDGENSRILALRVN